MDRFRPLDVTNSSLGAVLGHDEEVLSLVPGVGLYDGRDKALHQASGTIYVTNLRLIYVDDAQPHRYSCHLDWRLVKATEYYAGFLKSSPKVTLVLAPAPDAQVKDSQGAPSTDSVTEAAKPVENNGNPSARKPGDWRRNVQGAFDSGNDAAQLQTSWVCRICAFSNDASSADKCQLCGVARDPSSERSQRPSSSSPSSSRPSVSQDAAPPPAAGAGSGEIACPTCTFLNHPSMLRCEICDSALGTHFPAQQTQPERPKSAGAAADGRSIHASKSTPSLREPQQPPNMPQYPWSQAKADPPQNGTSTPVADHVKLSFRKGGVQECYTLIKSTLKAKAWARAAQSSATGGQGTPRSRPSAATAASDIDGRGAAMRKAGIDGILRAADSTNREQTADMADALKDLEALMQKAKQMVDLAESLNNKLVRQEAASGAAASGLGKSVEGQVVTESSEAATLIRSSLVRLGLPAPAVTEDMARDEVEYHQELARELAQILLGNEGLMGRGTVARKGQAFSKSATPQYLQSDLMRGRGLIGLDEVWCVWNRARGVALVSPKALHTVAAKFLPQVTQPPIELRKFKSGLSVLHTPRFSIEAFQQRLVQLLRSGEEGGEYGPGVPSLEVARAEDLPILLATEMVELVESESGLVVRDEGAKGGVRWYPNHIWQKSGNSVPGSAPILRPPGSRVMPV